MKKYSKYSVIVLSLAFLMSVGACDRHSGRDSEMNNNTPDTAIVEEVERNTVQPKDVVLTSAQKDSIKKAKKDSIIKSKQDSANQVIVNEIAKRIKEMPDSVLDSKLAEIVNRLNKNEKKISELETYVFIIGGMVTLLLIILYIWLFKKLKITDELYNELSDVKRSQEMSLKTVNSQIEKILAIIQEKKNRPQQKLTVREGIDASNDPRKSKQEEKSSHRESDTNVKKKTDSAVGVESKKIIYLGLPFNNQYFKEEEKSDSNCFVAELSASGGSGIFTLISLDRIKSDTISTSILNITGKVKLSDATSFETIVEGKIIKADDFWKVEIPSTILIS